LGGNQKTDKTAAEQAKREKADRLAKALRDNLHRRKAQARARKSPAIETAETGITVDIKIANSSKGDGQMIQPLNPDLTPESKG
jgi:hypothetical protein